MKQQSKHPESPSSGPAKGIGSTLEGTFHAALGAADSVRKTLLTPLRLPGVHRTNRPASGRAGQRPGIESEPDLHTPPAADTIRITCIDYSPQRMECREIDDLHAFVAEKKPEGVAVRWINIDGLHPYVVHQFMQGYGFHTLAAEDVLHTPQRPKLETYDKELFLIARMLTIHNDALQAEQISLFYRPDLLVTFQEWAGDVFEPIRKRLDRADSRLRNQDAGFLLYAILDAIIDHCFPILEYYGDLLEEMETRIAEQPDPDQLQKLHAIKRQLVQLRRVLWPTREALGGLLDEDLKAISPMSRTYLRDVQDHTAQVIDLIETYREMAAGLTDLYMSSISNRMNEVMKVLTIMASLFIPITFIAGVYGMNFDHIPELHNTWAYPVFWVVCITVVSVLLLWFRRKGWIG